MNEALLVDKGAWIVTFMASFLIWIMLGGLLVLWLIDGRIKKEQALHAFLSALIAWVIAEMLKNLIPSVRGEIEIVDLHKKYLDLGELDVEKVTGSWFDAGTFDSLLNAGGWASQNAQNYFKIL